MVIEHREAPAGREVRRWRQAFESGGWWLQATYRGQRFRPHWHNCHEIGVNESGTHAVRCGGGWQFAGPGHVVVVRSRETHELRQLGRRPWTYRALLIPPPLLGRLCAGPASLANAVYDDPRLASHLAAVHRLIELDPPAGQDALAPLLWQILERQQAAAPPARVPAPAAIARALATMESRLYEPTSLSDLAEAAELSRFHFLRSFRDVTGLTPRRFLVQRRVEEAGVLMCRGVAPSEAAHGLLFADHSHFTARFREIVGVAPSEFSRGVQSAVRGFGGCCDELPARLNPA